MKDEWRRSERRDSLTRSPQPREIDPLEQVRQTRIAADLICDWLAERGQPGPFGQGILKEVRDEFAPRTGRKLATMSEACRNSFAQDHPAEQA
jgi:hypothetical protein